MMTKRSSDQFTEDMVIGVPPWSQARGRGLKTMGPGLPETEEAT